MGSFHTTTTHGLATSTSSSTSGSTIVGVSRGPIVHPEVLTNPAQHAVDEAAGVVGGVALRQVDRLADGDAERDLGPPAQLVDGDAQQVAVDDRHPVDRPPVGELADDGVDLVAVLLHAPGELDGVGGGGDGQLDQQVVDARAPDVELVAQGEGPLPGISPRAHHQTRVRYSPVRVSTLMRSPVSTNSGTWTTAPVSSVAGFLAPDTRSPCTPGSVWATVSSTAAGSSTPTTCPWYVGRMTVSPSLMYLVASPRAAGSTPICS